MTGRSAAFSTSSGDDAKNPTALAKLHLEDGTTLFGRSFGCHKSVEGEVRTLLLEVVPSCVGDCFAYFFQPMYRLSLLLVWLATQKV